MVFDKKTSSYTPTGNIRGFHASVCVFFLFFFFFSISNKNNACDRLSLDYLPIEIYHGEGEMCTCVSILLLFYYFLRFFNEGTIIIY